MKAQDEVHSLPHQEIGRTGRCWCGSRLCVWRDRLKRMPARTLTPLIAVVAFAAAAGTCVTLSLHAMGWPQPMGITAGVAVATVTLTAVEAFGGPE